MSIKDKALARRGQRQLQKVEMPDWGEPVYIKGMSAAEKDDFEAAQVSLNAKGKALHNFRARLVVATACDEQGNRVFSDEDVDALGELPAKDVAKLFDVATKLNGMSKEDVEDLEKNS